MCLAVDGIHCDGVYFAEKFDGASGSLIGQLHLGMAAWDSHSHRA